MREGWIPRPEKRLSPRPGPVVERFHLARPLGPSPPRTTLPVKTADYKQLMPFHPPLDSANSLKTPSCQSVSSGVDCWDDSLIIRQPDSPASTNYPPGPAKPTKLARQNTRPNRNITP